MAIHALEPKYGLPILLKVAGMARSTYYYRLGAISAPDKYASLRTRIKELHLLHKGRYGYRRLTASLRQEGHQVNHKTVRKLMRAEGIVCKIRTKRKRFNVSPELAASPNILSRRFYADAPFRKGVTDVTEFNVGKQRVYVSALLDLYDGAVISITHSLSNDTDLIMSMFNSLPAERQHLLDNMLIHSDQGVLYRTVRYHDFVRSHSIIQSMSRRANCYDNASVESFFGTFKCETMRIHPITSLNQLIKELHEYTAYYNEVRLKSTLGYKSPFQYRKENGFENFTNFAPSTTIVEDSLYKNKT